MFSNTIQAVIEDVSPNRESREEGALTCKVTFQGRLTEDMRNDLGEWTDDILPDDGETPTFASVRLDKEWEQRRLTVGPASGKSTKVDRSDVKVKSVRLIKCEANAIDLRFVAHLGPVEKAEANFLINEYGHLVTVGITEQQQQLPLED